MEQEKKQNKFIAALKTVFIHNIGFKLLALGTAIVLWMLSVGL